MCWYCGSPVTDAEPLGRTLRCPACGRDLRVCRHCRRFLPGGGCAESGAIGMDGGADIPQDKERANFCDWFSLEPRFRETTAGDKKKSAAAASAKSAFDDLFK